MNYVNLRDDLVYFLHIPKTSGVSVFNYLTRVVDPDEMTPSVIWDDLITGRLVMSEKTRILSGHFGGLLPLYLKKWPRMMTMIREPIARAVSHINHVQRAPEHPLHVMAKGLSVLEYCQHPRLKRTVQSYQARYLATLQISWALHHNPAEPRSFAAHATAFDDALFSLDSADGLQTAAIESLQQIDAVGVVEEHWRSLNLFAKTFEWTDPVSEYRLNTASQNQWSLERLNNRERRLLNDLNKVDLEVYKMARDVFRRQCLMKHVPIATKGKPS